MDSERQPQIMKKQPKRQRKNYDALLEELLFEMNRMDAIIETPATTIEQRRLKEETEEELLDFQQELIMIIERFGGTLADDSDLEDTFGDLDINERYSSKRSSKL